MPSPRNEDRSPLQSHEAWVASLKARLEQARAEGQSPEQMQQLAMTMAHADAGRRATQVVGQVRSWWSGFKLFLMVGGLALALAMSLALGVEYRHAAPLCKSYGAEHHWAYQSLNYPNGGHSSNAGSARCVFTNASGSHEYVSLTKLEPNWLTDLGVSFAFEIEFTLPLFFVLIALLFAALKRLQKK
jgi:hypothetical protein